MTLIQNIGRVRTVENNEFETLQTIDGIVYSVQSDGSRSPEYWVEDEDGTELIRWKADGTIEFGENYLPRSVVAATVAMMNHITFVTALGFSADDMVRRLEEVGSL